MDTYHPNHPRRVTIALLEAVEEGLIDRDRLINAFTSYLLEAQVAEMCHNEELNELLFPEDEERDEEEEED